MTVPSVKYLLFLIVACAVSYALKGRFRILFLALASWGFYALCQSEYIALLIFSTAVCFFCAIAFEDTWFYGKKLWIVLGCIWLLGSLIFYKYLNFFLNLLSGTIGTELGEHPQRLMPIGISFYTFTSLAYLFDVAMGKVKAERNFLNCALYISFFPAVLSGPINRPEKLFPQIRELSFFSLAGWKQGILRIVIGTIKKLVVANTLGRFVDAVYASPSTASRGVVALAIAAYSFQIYFDFSGYTDIALGSAKILGFELPENFNAPYFAENVRDFWRRWHISLTSWFRDYLYIPLGGSRVSRERLYLNIMIVFVVSGLWHGAGWSFVIWGLLNGIYQVLEMLLKPVGERLRTVARLRDDSRLIKSIRILTTFILISVAWVFFRAETVSQAIEILESVVFGIATATGKQHLHVFSDYRPLILACFCILLFSVADYGKLRQSKSCFQNLLLEKSVLYWMTIAMLVVFIAVFGVYGDGFDASAFIYFQF